MDLSISCLVAPLPTSFVAITFKILGGTLKTGLDQSSDGTGTCPETLAAQSQATLANDLGALMAVASGFMN